MKHSKDKILSMDKDTFVRNFKSKFCLIELLSNKIEKGYVTEVGLAANINPQTNENLPVSIRVNGKNISITQIATIETN